MYADDSIFDSGSFEVQIFKVSNRWNEQRNYFRSKMSNKLKLLSRKSENNVITNFHQNKTIKCKLRISNEEAKFDISYLRVIFDHTMKLKTHFD